MVTGAPDATVVGGGPAGSALAIVLGHRGVRVRLYEKAIHPRLKPCGEGLLPHGVTALDDIAGLPSAPRVRGLRFCATDAVVDADFPEQPGLVVRRDRFDAWLFERAASTPNVDARPGTPYRPGPTGVLIGADGIRSMFHRRLPGRFQTPHRVGLSTHVDGIEGLGEYVEVFFHDEGELYLAPTGGGEALVSALFDYRHFRRDGVTYLLGKTQALTDRIARLRFTTPVLASAPLGLHVPRVVSAGPEGRLMLVGDAAGTPDPITAGGLALALSATRAAADAVVSGDLCSYQQRRLEMGKRADRLAHLLLRLSRNERRAAFVLRRFSSMIPKLVEQAVRSKATVGGPLRTVTSGP